MNDLRTAAQAALTALEMSAYGEQRMPERDKAMEGLRAALAQPEQEPVAWMCKTGHGIGWRGDKPPEHLMPFWTPLYLASPPQRKPLSEDEQVSLAREMVKGNKSVEWFVRAVEKAHGIGE